MKIPNPIENVIVAALTVTATVLIMNFTSIKPLERQIDRQNALIKELAELEKYQIQNNFDKLKSHKGQIVLDLNNDLSVTNTEENITVPTDSTGIEGIKKTFFEKLKFWEK